MNVLETINTYYHSEEAFTDFVQKNKSNLLSKEATAILVQVFCGINELDYLYEMTTVISSELPTACIIGATTFGEIMNGEVSGLKTALSITVFHNTTIRSGIFHDKQQNEFLLGESIAASLDVNNPKVLILFGAGDDVKAYRVMKGIEAKNPNLLVAGGNAGNNAKNNSAMVLLNHDIINNGYVGVALEGDELEARLFSHLGWQMIGKEMTITKAEGNRVYTINDIPAYQIYHRYLGIEKNTDFLNSIEFPLILNRDGFLMARTPRNYYEDDSIGFFGDVLENEMARLSFGDVGLITEKIDNLCQQIQSQAAESIFVYSCESRRGFLQHLSTVETQPLQRIAPTAGFFTTGEYYHRENKNYLLNATMTVLVLAEKNAAFKKPETFKQEKTLSLTKTNDKACTDSIVERYSGVLKALTHLINAVTTELEKANQDLNFVGTHDSLTGVNNRTFFDHAMNRLEKTDDFIGIIIVDIDYLKLVNDNLGHEFGDRMLRLSANIMTESCRKSDIIARIGGDEFAILVTGATEADLLNICNRIQENTKNARTSKDNNLLYISIGFSYKEKYSTTSLADVFTAADNAMYQYKSSHKKKVQREILQRLERMQKLILNTD